MQTLASVLHAAVPLGTDVVPLVSPPTTTTVVLKGHFSAIVYDSRWISVAIGEDCLPAIETVERECMRECVSISRAKAKIGQVFNWKVSVPMGEWP